MLFTFKLKFSPSHFHHIYLECKFTFFSYTFKLWFYFYHSSLWEKLKSFLLPFSFCIHIRMCCCCINNVFDFCCCSYSRVIVITLCSNDGRRMFCFDLLSFLKWLENVLFCIINEKHEISFLFLTWSVFYFTLTSASLAWMLTMNVTQFDEFQPYLFIKIVMFYLNEE